MKPRKTLSVYVLLVGVLGLSIVGGILAFQIFSATVKSQLTAEEAAAIKPIDGSISQSVIDNLQKRKFISETDLISTATPQPSPTPTTITLQPQSENLTEATQSATISAEPLQTQ